MTVKISAIVPVFNTEKYIESALNSLLMQTVKFHEIIAINDGSTDSSNEILLKYQSEGKIKLINQINQGLGPSRNNGIDIAQGDYIYFFDSDDLASSVMVETIQRELASCNELEIISFAGETFFDSEYTQANFSPSYERSAAGHFSSFFDAAVALETQNTNYSSACLYVIKKDALKSYRLEFCTCIHEDESFLLDLMASVGRSSILQDKLFYRRIRANSIMTSKKSDNHVNGYINAASVAKCHAIKSDSSIRKKYFYQRSIKFYLAAISISYQVENFHLYDSIYKRIFNLPTWKLSFPQMLSLLFGRNAAYIKKQLIRIFNKNSRISK